MTDKLKNETGWEDLQGSRIMVVEDDAMQRILLANVLEVQGYDVVHAENGRQALDKLEVESVDLVISDIIMPEMDGLELCRRLKEHAETISIPIILVTSLGTSEDILKGIDAGANEFLTKPIEPKELALRVRNAIRARKLFERVEKNFQELKNLEAMRDSLVHMMVHDMRSVLTGILTTADFLQERISDRLTGIDKKLYGNILSSSTTLMEMVSTVLDVNRMEEGKMPLDKQVTILNDVLFKVFELLGITPESDKVNYNIPAESILVECDPSMICRVIINLISNGIKYVRNIDDGIVDVTLTVVDGMARVTVSDNGQGIPSSDTELIFEKYAQSSLRRQKKRYSSGLGLYFCKMAVESHGGRIHVISESGEGASFFFELNTYTG